MLTKLSSVLLVALLAACGGSSNNGQPDGGTNPDGGMSGNDGSMGNPDGSMPPQGVYAIPLGTPAGQDQGSFYTAPFTAAGATFQLDLDSGSTTTGVAGMSCTTCTGLSPLYTPGTGATDTNKTASTQYADGSGWGGEIFSDMVGLGAGTPNVAVKFVSITSQMGGFFASSNEYQGILGMGPDALLENNTTSYFDAVTQAGVTNAMAFELCPTNGTMWLGGFDPAHAQGAMQYTPLLATGINKDFYSVNMTDMGIGGTSLGFTSSTFDSPIVDTGTSLFYVPTTVQTALINAVNASSGFKALFSGQTLAADGCVNASAGTTDAMVDAMLPEMSMSFAKSGSGSFTVSAKATVSYLYNAGGGQYCLDIEGGGENGNATMGDTILRAFVTVVDVQNKQIGFAPEAHCAAPLSLSDVPRGPMHEHGHGPHHVRAAQ
jgi:hypothetical protein